MNFLRFKKNISFVFFIFFALCGFSKSVAQNSSETPFLLGYMDTNDYVIGVSSWVEKEMGENSSLPYFFAVKDKLNRFEIRYSTFVENKKFFANVPLNSKKFLDSFKSFALEIAQKMSQNDFAVKSIDSFSDKDVAFEFNADKGISVFVMNAPGDFCRGYKYIMMNFFYKKNVGVMCQSILYNDLTAISTVQFQAEQKSFFFVK